MTFQLKKATMHYGMAEYPMHGLPVPEFIETIDDVDLDALARGLQQQNPSLSADNYRERMKTGGLPAMPEFNQPANIQILGNGFSIIWKEV